jgi:hypothetical protein
MHTISLKVAFFSPWILLFINFSQAGEVDWTINKIKMPKLEIEADVGLAWLAQGKACLNFADNFFGKIRYSGTKSFELGLTQA